MIPFPEDQATLTAEELAPELQISTWGLYDLVRRGQSPVPALKVGRLVRFPTAAVRTALGMPLTKDEAGVHAPAHATATPRPAGSPALLRALTDPTEADYDHEFTPQPAA